MAFGGLVLATQPLSADAASGSELYCLYNPVSGEYLYTIDPAEKTMLESTWTYEGIVCTMPSISGTATYRMYDPVSTKHLYTSDEAEILKLTAEGWQREGISYYVDEAQSAPVYRLLNPKTGDHVFGGDVTASKLEQNGWTREGIAYYSLSVNDEFTYSGADANADTNAGANDVKPWEVGFMILTESHGGVMEEAHEFYNADSSLSIPIPKMSVVFVGRLSEYDPLWFSGGITYRVDGVNYECFSEINSIMSSAPGVKLWYLVWFMGSNDVTKRGLDVAVDAMVKNITALDQQEFVTPHTMALITTPHKYGKTYESFRTIMDEYDDTELEFFRSIGYGDNCYDSREDFDLFVENGRLTGEEYKGYTYAHSGDGVHYYASQYWQVISNAINEIYP